MLHKEDKGSNADSSGYQQEMFGGAWNAEAVAERAKNVEFLIFLSLGQPERPFARHLEQQSYLRLLRTDFTVTRKDIVTPSLMNRERATQYEIGTFHRYELARSSPRCHVRSLDPHEICAGRDL